MSRVVPVAAAASVDRSSPAAASADDARDGRTLWISCGVFAALAATFAVLSEGFLTADALTHYLFAQHAFAEPHYFVDVWGRPFCTALYAAPAAVGGRLGVRLTSAALGIVCAVATYHVARRQGLRRPALAAIFTLGQPLLFLHGFSEMTELPFATLIALAFWAYQSRRWGPLTLLLGLAPLARPEGFGFVLLGAAALVLHRRAAWLLLLPVPLLLWNHAGWDVFGRHGPWWRWLPDNWPYAAESLYPRGYLLQFVGFLPVIVSPLVLPATILGIVLTLREAPSLRSAAMTSSSVEPHGTGPVGFPRETVNEFHLRACRVLTALVPLWVLGVHSFLSWTGKLGSLGEPRYLLVVAPFWALLSARGWEWAWQRSPRRDPVAWAAAAALAPLPVALALGVLPLKVPEDWQSARRVADWVRASGTLGEDRRVAASHPAIYYYLGVSPTDPTRTRQWRRDVVRDRPPGTLLIWDPLYGPLNAPGDRAFSVPEIERAGWVRVDAAPAIARGEGAAAAERWHIFRSP